MRGSGMDPASLTLLATNALHLILPYLKDAGTEVSKRIGGKLFELLARHGDEASSKSLQALKSEPQSAEAEKQALEAIQALLASKPDVRDMLVKELSNVPRAEINITAGDNANIVGQITGNADFRRS